MMEPGSLLIIIPTYNEASCIEDITTAILKQNLQCKPHILIVDDNSPDGTGSIADRLSQTHETVHTLHRPSKRGLGQAYISGFQWGLSKDYAWFLEMDADFSHNPHYLTIIEELINKKENDFLIGSRYIPQGGVTNWNWARRFISKGGNVYASTILQCPIRDLTGGFNAWSALVLKGINLSDMLSNGYSFQIEMKYRAYKKGFKYTEFPIIFEERRRGQSKMSRQIVWEAVFNTIKLRFRIPPVNP